MCTLFIDVWIITLLNLNLTVDILIDKGYLMATVSGAATHRGHEPSDPLITGLPEEHHAPCPPRGAPPAGGHLLSLPFTALSILKTKIEKNVKVTALVWCSMYTNKKWLEMLRGRSTWLH
jgi:hypothetical protein